ncbi:hypothetical protein [Solidesulfovibrio alcoholivorans]|uniref:hypothetical protein n=1 Tax=Solidesulfovibrio alcoholivorans TaxID=81406 RepID=UPI0004975504|nr:hypothetical protein [Solidesulfovibrio alcoholivorans]
MATVTSESPIHGLLRLSRWYVMTSDHSDQKDVTDVPPACRAHGWRGLMFRPSRLDGLLALFRADLRPRQVHAQYQ